MNKKILKYIVDAGLAISFFLVFITGIVKFPLWRHHLFFVYDIISPNVVSRIHDWSGIAMGLLVLVHLMLNFRWIVAMTKDIFKEIYYK